MNRKFAVTTKYLSRLFLVCAALLSVLSDFSPVYADEGTSVGNFNHKIQPEFDFRIMYPAEWRLFVPPTILTETEREAWIIDNSRVAPTPQLMSWIKVSFLFGFPAVNDQELLAEAKKRHPGLNFSNSKNPDFVGIVSDQTPDGPTGTHSFEYYFIDKNRVARIESRRDSSVNGAAVVDLIISTIRKASKPMEIQSIEMNKKVGASYSVGEDFCYIIKLDVLRLDREVTSSLRFQAFKPHFSHQRQKWDSKEGKLEICGPIDSSFGREGLTIESLAIIGSIGSTIYCSPKTIDLVECRAGKETTNIPFTSLEVKNPNPDVSGPRITSLNILGSNKFTLEAMDPSGIEWAKVNVSLNDGREVSKYIFSSEFGSKSQVVEFPESLLTSGFSRIDSIVLMDKVGNVSILKAHPTASNYFLIPNSRKVNYSGTPPVGAEPATPTTIPIGYFKGTKQ